MKTTIHNHLRGQNGCLGFYYGLASLLSAYPEGGLPGEFFINGETQSIWIWDSTGRSWYDTNHAAPSPFMGIITEPATFSPAVESGVQACFIYVAGGKGSYVFPALKGSAAMTVTTDSSAIITLVWDGTAWRNYVTPLTLTMPCVLFISTEGRGIHLSLIDVPVEPPMWFILWVSTIR